VEYSVRTAAHSNSGIADRSYSHVTYLNLRQPIIVAKVLLLTLPRRLRIPFSLKYLELDTLQTQQKQDIQKIQKEINLQRYIEDVALASASDRLKVSHFNE
jgi:hypothetical protein